MNRTIKFRGKTSKIMQTFSIDQIQEMLKELNWTALQNTAELIKKGAKLYVPDELDYEKSNADSICLLGTPHKLIRPTTIDQVWTENLTLDGLGWDFYEDNPKNRQDGYGQLFPHYLDFVIKKIVEKHGLEIPSNEDWNALVNSVQGNALTLMNKSMGGTNESGFGVLPAGYRSNNGSAFLNRGYSAVFWSSSAYSATYAWYRNFHYAYSQVERYANTRSYGLSVRCVRDLKITN
jgi:uncharacterized protein (TIGR02145 family)